MISFIFSLEQLRIAPPEVQRWALEEIAQAAAALGRPGHDRLLVKVCALTARMFAEASQILEPIAAISFGPFRLIGRQRLLLEANKPVRLGDRALDILIALLDRPGQLLSKDELISRVWPDTHVGDNNLKCQVAVLRRALHDGCNGRRYLARARGQGYRFVAPVRVEKQDVPTSILVSRRR